MKTLAVKATRKSLALIGAHCAQSVARGRVTVMVGTPRRPKGTTYYWDSETGAAQYQQPSGLTEAATHAGAYQPAQPRRAQAQPVSRDRSSSGMRGLAGAFAKRRSSADNIFGAGKRAFPSRCRRPCSIGSTKTAPVGPESPATRSAKSPASRRGRRRPLNRAAASATGGYATRGRPPRGRRRRRAAAAPLVPLRGRDRCVLLPHRCRRRARARLRRRVGGGRGGRGRQRVDRAVAAALLPVRRRRRSPVSSRWRPPRWPT